MHSSSIKILHLCLELNKLMRILLVAYFTFLLFFLFCLPLYSQHLGGNPPHIKWMQINHDSLRVIFPTGMEKQAKRIYSNTLQMSRYHRQGIGHKTKKIDIVLQNQTVVPNGYAGLAPYRSEFFASPPHDNRMDGSLNWIDQLSIHEYRHALQFINARYGLTKLAYYLSGESGWAVMMNLSLPNWYFEGDAVMAETQHSPQGRGRLSAFFNNSRALEHQNIRYNYEKARNGSLKDRVPNDYEMGFIMSAYGNEKHGWELWENTLKDATAYKKVFYPFSQALKKYSGLNTATFYDSSMYFFDKKWEKIDMNTAQIGQEVYKEETTTVSNYSFPFIENDSTFYFIKSTYKSIPKLYKQEKKTVKQLFSPGITLNQNYDLHSDKIIWSALSFDERWGWQQFSDIYQYHQNSGKKERLTNKKRYYSPSFSADGSEILVFENSEEQVYTLKILHAESAALKEEIPNPEQLYFSFPKFSMDSSYILSIARNKEGQNALLQIHRKSGEYTELLVFSFDVITRFAESSKGIFLVWGFNGVDNIYFLDNDKKLFRLSNSPTGILDLAVDSTGKQLLYTEYDINGDKLKKLSLDSVDFQAIDMDNKKGNDVFDYSFIDSKHILNYKNLNDSVEIEKYSLHSNLINIHSWLAILKDPYYGIMLQSENILNTFKLESGYEYNSNESESGVFLRAVYAQYYPIIHLAFESYGRSSLSSDKPDLSWNEERYSIAYTFPFNFSGGLYYRFLNFRHQYSYRNIHSAEGLEEGQELMPSLQAMSLGSSFKLQRIAARQNIFTHLGVFAAIRYNDAIDWSKSNQLFTELDLSLKGLFPNHNLLLESEYQKRKRGSYYQFSNAFNYSRGFKSIAHDQMYALSANYHLPLFYPDWGFGGISYYYRLRLNLFFDYSKRLSGELREYNSTGAELIFDSRIFNVLDISYGIRYSYIMNSQTSAIESDKSGLIEFFIPFGHF